MKAKLLLPTGAVALYMLTMGAELSQAGCKHLRRQDPERGLAIMSPVECPDLCETPVGGCYRYTPYYPGYLPDKCPMLYVPQSGYSVPGPGFFNNAPAAYGRSDYGSFTGASKDEATLVRLGGRSNAAGIYQPTNPATGDLIDRIQGSR